MRNPAEQVPLTPPAESEGRLRPFQFRLAHIMWFTLWFSGLCSMCAFGGVVVGLLYITATFAVLAAVFRPLLFLVAIVGLAIFTLFDSMLAWNSRTPSRRAMCQNNLWQIAIALHAYKDEHGHFPTDSILDANGKPMHSWRVLILPYLEQKPLYDAYRFDEPWDGPNNRKLAVPLSIYQCPSASDKERKAGMTNYVAIVGPGTMWDDPNGVQEQYVADGLGKTILVVEIADSDIHWMEPRDLDIRSLPKKFNSKSGLAGISSKHTGGACIATADGRVYFLDEQTTAETLEALLTRNGGEDVDIEILR